MSSRLIEVTAAATAAGEAVRKLALAASASVGADCYLHAELTRRLLADLGLTCKTQVGFAAWRVGRGDGDVIAHTFKVPGYLPEGAIGLPFHAWVTWDGISPEDDILIDTTTYQLPHKARALDALDGGHTVVEWCPELLVVPRSALSSYETVAKAPGPGVFYYEQVPQLQARVSADFVLEEDAMDKARLILANPGVMVMGPNDLPQA